MTRIPYPDLSVAPEPIRRAIEDSPVDMAVIRMFAHASGAFEGWQRMNLGVIYANSLEAVERELAICVVTSAESPYEHAYHRVAFLAAGFSEAQRDALETGEFEAEVFDDREQAVLAFAGEVRTKVKASDETLARLRRHYSDRQVVELILCVAQYMMNSRVAENAGITLDDDRALAKPGQVVP